VGCLGNYVTALGYGTGGAGYRRWWTDADRRVHLAGKGVLRFHAVYWPAILLSAGQPLPTDILVHDYLTLGGSKISKSGGSSADPAVLAGRYGTDAVRWWLLREVPRVGDADFTEARLVARADEDLANDLGNLVSRVVTLVHRYRQGTVPPAGTRPAGGTVVGAVGTGGTVGTGGAGCAAPQATPLAAACRGAPQRIAAALGDADFRAASAAVWDIVEEANRYVELARPWRLAAAERDGDRGAGVLLDQSLALLVGACREIGRQLAPFLPGLAARVQAACHAPDGALPAPQPVFPRIEVARR
jgi:methionyl-tRNA synthetase